MKVRLGLFITGALLLLILVALVATPKLARSQVNPPPISPRPSMIPVPLQQSIDKAIPESVYPCLSSKVKKAILLATARQDKYTYYLMLSFTPSSFGYDHWTRAIVATDKVGCLRLNPDDEDYPRVSMSEYVPEQVAREFALQHWKSEIEKSGGQEKFRQELFDHLQPGEYTYVLFPEDIWALERLGISIPKKLLR